MTIDKPSANAAVKGSITISGWALNASGINRVDIYVYDSQGKVHPIGSVPASKMTARSDVAKAFANQGYANIATSGYSLTVDITSLDNGSYKLAVAGIGKNGKVQWGTQQLNIKN